jgi:hypothetical protein
VLCGMPIVPPCIVGLTIHILVAISCGSYRCPVVVASRRGAEADSRPRNHPSTSVSMTGCRKGQILRVRYNNHGSSFSHLARGETIARSGPTNYSVAALKRIMSDLNSFSMSTSIITEVPGVSLRKIQSMNLVAKPARRVLHSPF